MHIGNVYLTNRTLGQPEQPAATPDEARSAAAPPATLLSSTHVPSVELIDLVDQLRQTPEVRKEALQRVAQRLANGYYASRAAAVQTAEAIQEAQE